MVPAEVCALLQHDGKRDHEALYYDEQVANHLAPDAHLDLDLASHE